MRIDSGLLPGARLANEKIGAWHTAVPFSFQGNVVIPAANLMEVLGSRPQSCDHMNVAKRFQYEFEWDPVKARQNLRKHHVAFERAATIFLDQAALSEFDAPESGDEDRWITLGLDRTGALLVVSHTYREESEASARIRLISARKPTNNEAKEYERK